MSLSLTDQTSNLMTSEQIAGEVGISRANVIRKKGINEYFAGIFPNPAGTGRPIKMYRPEALSLWGRSDEKIRETSKKLERKGRNDKGGVRWTSPEKLQEAIKLVKQLYINNAQPNLKLACEQASKMMQSESTYKSITGSRLHRRLQRNGKDGDFRSEYFQENWELIRMKQLKLHDHSLQSTGTLKYNWWEILEDSGVAGKGFGACSVIVIDDFKRDAWSIKDGKLEMPVGLAYIDGLTGYPLLLLPARSITTESVAAGMVMVAYAYGLPENAVWVMENSKAMKNVNIEMLARSLYTKDELYDFENGKIEWIKNVFAGQTGPVCRNLPYIPRHAFKARIERFFKIIKDEFDATRFPLNYQGGSRQEATQLTLASMPMAVGRETKDLPLGFYTVEYEEYWEHLYKWLYSDCIMRQRPTMLKGWATAKTKYHSERVSPTINECWNYYRGDKNKRAIDPERLAYLLYWAQPKRHEPRALWTVRQTLFIQPTIKDRHLNLFSEAISEGVIGRKLATVPIPNNPNIFLLFIADDPTRPEFLCVAEDYTAKKNKDIPVMRTKVTNAREQLNSRLDDGAKTLAAWENQHELGAMPEEPEEWTKQLLNDNNYLPAQESKEDEENPETPEQDTEPKNKVEISDDMADLINEVDDLLNK